MGTTENRRREFEIREERLLDVAGPLLIEQGFDGLTMDRLSEATNYSKGLMYKHFTSKEDLVAALAVRSLNSRLKRFRTASAFQGKTRERLLAIEVGEELSFRHNPHHMGSELVIKMAGLQARIAPERRERLQALERECFEVALALAVEAIDAEELVLESPLIPADLILGIMSLKWGTFSMIQNDRPLLLNFGLVTPLTTFRALLQNLLDGFGWRPLSTEWDYQESHRRILQELFAEEALQLGMS